MKITDEALNEAIERKRELGEIGLRSALKELRDLRRGKLWTGNYSADSALILLDRIDVSNEDFDRIEQVKEIIRGLVNSK